MKIENLKDLMVEELKDLYSAEKQITVALPKMIKAASAPELKQAFQQHLTQTENQIERLDQILEQLKEKPGSKKCKGMEGIIQDGKELMEEDAEPEVLDAGLIGAAQRVEHYEIAGYGCAKTYATLLGLTEVGRLLDKTLAEEKETDVALTELAESINVEADKAA